MLSLYGMSSRLILIKYLILDEIQANHGWPNTLISSIGINNGENLIDVGNGEIPTSVDK